jgi:hypothetical protein
MSVVGVCIGYVVIIFQHLVTRGFTKNCMRCNKHGEEGLNELEVGCLNEGEVRYCATGLIDKVKKEYTRVLRNEHCSLSFCFISGLPILRLLSLILFLVW